MKPRQLDRPGAAALKIALFGAFFGILVLIVIIPFVSVYALLQGANSIGWANRIFTGGSASTAGSPEISGPRVITTNGHPHLNVPILNQQKYWPSHGQLACGVTSVYMALKYYEHYGYSGLIHTESLNRDYYHKNFVIGYNTQRAWQYYLSKGQPRNPGRVSDNDWQVVKTSIANYHPVIAYGRWNSFGGIHIVAIVGIHDDTIVIADPTASSFNGIRTLTKKEAERQLSGKSGTHKGQYLINTDGAWQSNVE